MHPHVDLHGKQRDLVGEAMIGRGLRCVHCVTIRMFSTRGKAKMRQSGSARNSARSQGATSAGWCWYSADAKISRSLPRVRNTRVATVCLVIESRCAISSWGRLPNANSENVSRHAGIDEQKRPPDVFDGERLPPRRLLRLGDRGCPGRPLVERHQAGAPAPASIAIDENPSQDRGHPPIRRVPGAKQGPAPQSPLDRVLDEIVRVGPIPAKPERERIKPGIERD